MPSAIALFGLLLAASPPAPKLVAPSEPVRTGEIVPVRIVAVLPGGVSIDGCAPIELERHVGDRWTPLATPACPVPVPATAVPTELTVSIPPPEPGEYRAVVAWGTGCAAGQPLAVAACERMGVARSSPFTVEAPPAPPPAPAAP